MAEHQQVPVCWCFLLLQTICCIHVNVKTTQLSSYSSRRADSTYEIRPVDWIENGKDLRVVEDWGEPGGHMTLKQVDVPE